MHLFLGQSPPLAFFGYRSDAPMTLQLVFVFYDSEGIFQDLEHGGCQPTLGGPFPSLLLSFSLSPSLPFPSLPHFPLKPGGVVRKLGGY